MKLIFAERGRWHGRWVQEMEIQTQTTNTLTSVAKDNQLMEIWQIYT